MSATQKTAENKNQKIKRHNIKLNFSKRSVISEHILQFSHNFDRDNVKILDSEFL